MGCFESFPTVNYCCGCISLEAGAFTLGILKLISSWTIILLAVYKLSDFEKQIERGDEIFVYILFGLAIYMIFVSVTAILLIFGAFKKNVRLVNVYLWLELFLTIFVGLVVIIAVIDQFLGDDPLKEAFLMLLLTFFLKMYLLVCVISYYVDLYRQRTRGAYACSLNLATAPPAPIVAQSYMYPHIYYASSN
uniref:CSON014027 protein n=1 Tax=Culicoides sonorensis TaxID=179676 RepID=A0A336M9E0_CULSO